MTLRTFAAFALIAAPSLHAQTVAPPAQPDLGIATPLAGTWTYARLADGGEATFRDSAARPQLTVRCARSLRRVTISKPSSAAAPFLFVWTSSASRSVPASFDPATGQLSARLAAFDGLLDALTFSRGRFAVSVAGAPPLVLPAWAEPVRVIEDCRV